MLAQPSWLSIAYGFDEVQWEEVKNLCEAIAQLIIGAD
jgi:thiamine monophosphate kinase